QPSLPAGVEMRPFYDQSNIVNESIASVRDAIVIGLFLSGLIIWLFLRDWGTALMTGLVVPVTMVVTFIAMKLLGQSFNLMTLGLALVWTGNLSIKRIRRGQAAHAPAELHADAAHPLPAGFATNPNAEQLRRLMAAEEASLKGGFFERVLVWYERTLRRSLHS